MREGIVLVGGDQENMFMGLLVLVWLGVRSGFDVIIEDLQNTI
jgi:hypothetical protein